MIRMRLIENRTGEYIGVDVFAPTVPGRVDGSVLTLTVAEGPDREFYLDGPGVWAFVEVDGVQTLSHVDLVVTETMDSRLRNAS